ncbi:ATP-dependent helicase [soil metagenome]
MTVAEGALASFHAPVRDWFSSSFETPTRSQELGWPAIASGASTLVLAPTGSGKTLAAFLSAIDNVMFAPPPERATRCRVVYVSPLKALAVDVERNLRAPLVGIARAAERARQRVHEPTVAVRTGDTPSRERARFAREPADILVTTPESLFLLLTSNARDALRGARWVIVDEIHALVGTKRGTHLALSLERLEELTGTPPQRIGLSATQRPLDEVARFLGGFHDPSTPRPVTIVDAGQGKKLDLRVEVPVEDMARLGEPGGLGSGPASQSAEARSSIWPAIHPLLVDLVRAHRSTLIFVNSRRLAERLASALNELAGEKLVHAHHGSIAREQRLQIEDDLKAGRLPALVATSSLELGIDMGAIDLVVLVEAPPSVASAIQRIGRAGHRIDEPSTGVILPKYRGDLLACAALTERMYAGAVEQLRYPRNPLDVLAQQVVGMVAMDEWDVDALERTVRRAAPFVDLTRGLLESVLDMLSGRYPSDEFADLRPRIVWDRVAGTLRAREGAKRVVITNAGTIPDRGLYGVFLIGAEKGKGRVGELDEEMVFESRVGETFLLGASSWRIEEIRPDRVIVSPAPGTPGKMPFWKGETAARPLEFGRAIGALSRTLRSLPADAATQRMVTRHALDERAARNILAYFNDQIEAAGAVPDDRTIVVERYLDEMGDWRVCVLSPFGGKVHAPWAMAIAAMHRERTGAELDMLWGDDGIVARFGATDEPPPADSVLPVAEDCERLVSGELSGTALFAGRFREAAGRALLLPRRYPGQRAPLWQTRRRASQLMQATSRFGSFPIVLEAYRECLRDVFDMGALVEVLSEIRSRAVRVVTVDSRTPSPFAAALLFTYVANFIYEGDAPVAERRAQALTVDPGQLRELLGEVELRELLDADALAELELALQHLTPERSARHVDGAHDLLLRLGDLSDTELAARCTPGAPVADWTRSLERERRVARVQVAGTSRLIAAEDAARYRDALGVVLPPGLPEALLETALEPLLDLVRRYARTHGPFTAADLAARLGIGPAAAEEALTALAAACTVAEGAFRPGGSGAEWCDANVLRTLRQRSIARLRREVEPVERSAFGRLEVSWHGVDRPRPGGAALLDAIAQLQGAPLPASDLEARILPARVAGYDGRDLDALLSAGAVVWAGAGALGPRDGRLALYLSDHAAVLMPERPAVGGELHERIRAYLRERGASFFAQILIGAGGGFPSEVLEALWDLVWGGEITSDTLQPVRAVTRQRPHRGRVDPRAARVRSLPPEAAGRWSLTATWRGGPSGTERIAARVRQLLDRYGVLTREAVQAEEVEGGFTAVYGVLKAMEDTGRIRRGYFVAGSGATQFALPGAIDRLRAVREPGAEPEALTLAATDPATPYGAGLPWPGRTAETLPGRRPMRAAGAVVVLVDGALGAWLGRGERQLLTFLDDDDALEPRRAALARALASDVAPGRRRTLFIDAVDGAAVAASPLAPALRDAGFTPVPRGYLRRV